MTIDCQIHKNLLDELKKISIDSDEEICGFVVGGNTFIKCENIHPNPKDYFLISPNEYIWEDDIMLFHSHPKHIDINGFSDWDIENQFYFQLKMLLYSVKHNEFYFRDL
jgi:proteasome lid subunit RPN8/RPN11